MEPTRAAAAVLSAAGAAAIAVGAVAVSAAGAAVLVLQHPLFAVPFSAAESLLRGHVATVQLGLLHGHTGACAAAAATDERS